MQDVDFYHYIEYIQRQKRPLVNESTQAIRISFFDQHYPIAKSFVQTLRPKHMLPRIVREEAGRLYDLEPSRGCSGKRPGDYTT